MVVASWPLCRLIVDDEHLVFRFPFAALLSVGPGAGVLSLRKSDVVSVSRFQWAIFHRIEIRRRKRFGIERIC